MRLQTILFPDREICDVAELYYHRAENVIQFDGYFNLFYIEKRKKYTELKGLRLHIRAKGYKRISLMRDRSEIESRCLKPDREQEYSFEFPYRECNRGVFWFSLEEADEAGEEKKLEGYYEGICEATREINIAAVICTYKREPYVLRNLNMVEKKLFSQPELEAAAHVRIWAVDNGNTLSEHSEISRLATVHRPDGRFQIFPNRNTGGAGGFTRGMLEALRRKKELGLTHVLLMDDDAVFDPELFVRAYGFLATVREEYRNIRLGGTLMREDFPYIQQAAGEWFEKFTVRNDNPLADLRTFESCTEPVMCGTEKEKELYSGWWCCCFSLDMVRHDNLPIPLFLHHDDIEYGLRNREESIAFLNGIGVWHKGFELTFSGVNLYYDVRNTLITTALMEENRSRREICRWIWKKITAHTIEFRYAETRLVYRALQDFCRGPIWLYTQDSDALNRSVRQMLESQESLDSNVLLTESERELVERKIRQYRADFGLEKIQKYYSPVWRRGGFIKKITYNGWLFPADKQIEVLSPLDSPFRAFRKKRIVLFEPFTEKKRVVKKDWRQFAVTLRLYIETAKLIHRHYDRSADAYRKNWPKITNSGAWTKYLGAEMKRSPNFGRSTLKEDE